MPWDDLHTEVYRELKAFEGNGLPSDDKCFQPGDRWDTKRHVKKRPPKKICQECWCDYRSSGPTSKYCQKCSYTVRKRKSREGMRRKRAND